MNKYFSYLLTLNMIANVTIFIPRILLLERESGMVWGILIAVILGMVFLWIHTNIYIHFPGKGLPELLQKYLPVWFGKMFLFISGLVWYIAGLITLVGCSFLSKRYLNPEMSLTNISVYFLIVISAGILLKTEKILYLLEFILIICAPLIIIIFLKAALNENINWQLAQISITYWDQLPSYTTISTALFSILGFMNITVYNRVWAHQQTLKKRYVLSVGIIGLFNLFTTTFIPIGFNGMKGVGEIVYPWIFTADSLRMEFFFLERVFFIFLLLYLIISVISMIIHWHVMLEVFKSFAALGFLKFKGVKLGPFIYIILFSVISIQIVNRVPEFTILDYVKIFYNSTIPYILFKLLILFIIYRKAKRHPI